MKRKPPLLLRPLIWVKSLLSLQLRLQRRGRQFRLVLDHGESPPIVPPPPAAAASAAPDAQTASLAEELGRLLAKHRQARQLMRHLAYVEQLLRRAGPDALGGLPLDVLQKAFAQLQQLAPNRSSPALAELRQRLAVVLADKEEATKRFEPTNSALSVFDSPQRLQVCEASPSDFEALQKAQR